MRIVFGWNRIKLKTFTLEELNIEPLEQFPNAKIRVAQSYFHLFWIPFFPLGKRYDLIMNNQAYHIPPSMWAAIDKEQIRAKGKWYAWSLPILAIVIFIGIALNGMYVDHKRREQSLEYAESQRKFFDNPMVGDHMSFSNDRGLAFDAEVFSYNDKTRKVMLLVNLLKLQDEKLLQDAEAGKASTTADTLMMIMAQRDQLESTSVFADSLLEEYPDQPIFRKLLTFELEEFPIDYKFVEMTLAEYKNFKNSIGDGYVKFSKPIKIPALKEITKYRLYVNPE